MGMAEFLRNGRAAYHDLDLIPNSRRFSRLNNVLHNAHRSCEKGCLRSTWLRFKQGR